MKVPTGTVIAFAGSQAERIALEAKGWLTCDGRMLSRHQYPELYVVLTPPPAPAKPDQFSLPDLRGRFVRGLDETGRVDPDGPRRGVRSLQPDMLAAHAHSWDHFFFTRSASGNDIAVHQPPDSPRLSNHRSAATNRDGGGAETRPKNVAVYFLIASGIRL